jgi:stearoyl-CoA desaturase (delta-9 desaturase)
MIVTTLFFFYIYSAIGVSMVLHRYYTHRSYEFKYPLVKWIFTGISIVSSRGTPMAWARVHRMHHKHADTNEDPHKPEKLSLFSFRSAFGKDIDLFVIRDMLTKEHKFINQYYILMIATWCLILLLISPTTLYFAWILPVCFNQVTQDAWNYYAHVNVGYRNFSTKDNSQNFAYLWPFILGEAWHNNHHYSPRNYNLGVKKTELDPIAYLINLVKQNV